MQLRNGHARSQDKSCNTFLCSSRSTNHRFMKNMTSSGALLPHILLILSLYMKICIKNGQYLHIFVTFELRLSTSIAHHARVIMVADDSRRPRGATPDPPAKVPIKKTHQNSRFPCITYIYVKHRNCGPLEAGNNPQRNHQQGAAHDAVVSLFSSFISPSASNLSTFHSILIDNKQITERGQSKTSA